MKIHKLAIAISTALFVAPMPSLAKCVTDDVGNVECKSNGLNEVFQVTKDQNINKYSLVTKGYTTMENKGAINEAIFSGSGITLDINNYGNIGDIKAWGVAGDINIHNYQKIGGDEMNNSGSNRIEITDNTGSTFFINDGEFKGDSIALYAQKSVRAENNGSMAGWMLDLRSKDESINFKNTGDLIFGNGYLDSASNISFINTGTVSTEFGLSLQAYEGDLSLFNSGIMNTSIDLYSRSADIINTGTIANSSEDQLTTLYTVGAKQVIYNYGTIENTSEDGYAINSRADNTSLYLGGDWQINGRVQAENGGLLGLTGEDDSYLDISRISAVTDTSQLDAIMGFNTLEKTGSSLWTLSGDQTSGGFTTATINEGALLLSNATLRMAPVTGDDSDNSTSPRYAMTNNAMLYVDGRSILNGSLINNGTLQMNDGVTATPTRLRFNTFTITGDYTGKADSTLVFNTRLGNDNSQTDKLLIKGNTAGESQVIVNNLGGKGGKTVQGIKLISVEGRSDGVFRKADGTRIVAGAYDYDLVKSDNQNWYLSSSLAAQKSAMMLTTGEQPEATAAMPASVASSVILASEAAPSATAVEDSSDRMWRPESGSYAANMLAANTLFTTSLHDRSGESQYTDALTGEQKVTSMWLRNVGGHQRSKMSDGQNKTQANRYVMQLGGDLAQWSSDGNDRYHLGVMAGYANQKSRTRSSVTDYSSRGQIHGYSAGLYGTWYANSADKSGLYVDSWLQYNWFDNSVKGDNIASESYKSRGLTGSLEAGYSMKVGETTSRQGVINSFWLQPQAQATWMGVKAKSHTEANGTRVHGKGQDNVQTRLGMKAYMQGHSALDNNTGRTFQPYLATNWIHNTKKMGVTMDGESNVVSGTKNAVEVKAGVEGQISQNLNLWGGVAQQFGGKGYSDSQATLGVKYLF